MSSDSHNNSNKENTSVVSYRRNAHFGSSIQYTSSVFINIQQLQTDLQTQYQHEKDALNELNQRFYQFIDRVQLLESQNSKYLAEVIALRRQSSGDSGIDIQTHERFLHAKSDLSTSRIATVDYESDLEWFQLQIGIYQQLINTEQQWKDKRCSKLEQELKQLASELIALRTSYAELERTAGHQYAERDNVFKQYMTLTYDWCNLKKQRKRWDVSVETLKNYIAFYKNLRSYSTRNYESSSIQVANTEQYWTLELDKSIKRIRHDFEVFYATIYRQLNAYYESKTEEVTREVEQTSHYQRLELEEFVMTQQTLQVEYEKVQHTLTYEREIQTKLESAYSKLEAEFKSLEIQYEDRFEAQSKEAYDIQESIVLMAADINEIQRSKVNLEAEIIVYRYLLDSSQLGGQITIAPHKQTFGNEMAGKFIAKAKQKRSVGIKECAVNGKYISLMNHSPNKDIDISRWMLKRYIDSAPEIRYRIPDGVRLQRGKELRIYSKLGAESSNQSAVSSLVQQQIVNNDLATWGVGNTMETILFNQNGEEEASYLQSVEFRKNNT